jgi:hypothetical protein
MDLRRIGVMALLEESHLLRTLSPSVKLDL